jgi:hypothetical protein
MPGIRDVDVVIDDADFARFHWQLKPFVVRRNRFGGLRLMIAGVPIDAWSLSQTWAFRQGYVVPQSFQCLASTPFLNIDSIVADISFFYTKTPQIYAKRFIEAFERKTLAIELRANPFPWLAAVKTLRAMYKYNLALSRPLAVYLNSVLDDAGEKRFEREQIRHYRQTFLEGEKLTQFRRTLAEYLDTDEELDRPFSPSEQKEFPQFKKSRPKTPSRYRVASESAVMPLSAANEYRHIAGEASVADTIMFD